MLVSESGEWKKKIDIGVVQEPGINVFALSCGRAVVEVYTGRCFSWDPAVPFISGIDGVRVDITLLYKCGHVPCVSLFICFPSNDISWPSFQINELRIASLLHGY